MRYIKEFQLRDFIRQALKEDIGKRDITTQLFIPKDKQVKAVIVAKENSVICGLSVASMVFKLQDRNIKFKPLVGDGDMVKKGRIIAWLSGRARSILTAERVALNFLGLLSGISTKTKEFIEAIKPYKTKILDTRKTIPGLRMLEKYAVRVGGGYNHRFSLDEMVLVKDNHLKVINPKSEILNPKQILNSKLQNSKLTVEIEVKSLKEFKEALKLNPDIIMLDNMSIKDMKRAVILRNRRTPNTEHLTPKLEASGGITLKNVRKVASCGVDMISLGALTHSVNSVDISLEIQ